MFLTKQTHQVNPWIQCALVGCFLVACSPGVAQGQPVAPATNAPPVAAKPKPKPKWERSAALGLTLERGNSDNLLFTVAADASRQWHDGEVKLGADGTYGETSGTKSTETAHGFGQYNRVFNKRFYAGLRLDLLHDAIADLDYRGTLAPLVGYYFIKTDQTSLGGELGPAFIYEKLGGRTTGYMTARVGENFQHKFGEKARIWQSIEFLPQVDRLDNYLIHGEVGVEASLTKRWSLRTALQDYFDNQPAPGRKKNDVRLVTSIAYKF